MPRPRDRLVDPSAPLPAQLAAQARKKDWNHETIAVHARLKKERVDKYLAPVSKDIRPDAVARIGIALGIDVNPFPPKGSFRRMAFRVARTRAGLTIEELAADVATGQPPEAKTLLAKKIRQFENGGSRTNEAAIRSWVHALGRRMKRPVDLDQLGSLLPGVHRILETASWATYNERTFAHTRNLSVFCPPGAILEMGYSPTVFGAVYVELFRIRYDGVPATPARLSARHRGWEIGIVIKGRVRLRLLDATGTALAGDDEYVAGDLLTFRSDNTHEVEFLEDSYVVAINLQRNVLPGRRLR